MAAGCRNASVFGEMKMCKPNDGRKMDEDEKSGLVTRLLHDAAVDQPGAVEELFALIYDELHQMAKARMARERSEHTLQATALVHEVYLRLVGDQPVHWDGRAHFFGAAAEAMRRILVEHARHKQAWKSGGRQQRVDWSDHFAHLELPTDNLDDLLTLDQVLDDFARLDAHKAQLVKLLYFAGLNLEEAANAMGIARTTAYRHWLYARAWLLDAMTSEKRHPQS